MYLKYFCINTIKTKVKDNCIKCGGKRDISRGDGRLRTRCRICWNEYCGSKRKNHLEYQRDYHREYMPKYNKRHPKKYIEANNKSNKKARVELKDSYVKNILFKSKKSFKVDYELIELQRTLLKLKRQIKNECAK